MSRIIGLLLVVFSSISALANAAEVEWKIVPTETVCMVTEAYFARPQIPVNVGGKTYYGCCEGCKKTLTENASMRTATDALTNKSIDKATATIAANKSGKVLYFENKTNFEKYVKKHYGTQKTIDSKTNHSGHHNH